MYINKSIKTYLDDLAAKKPVPGGGSAAALSAAIGVGLMSMTANYTEGAGAITDILAKCEKHRVRLQDLVDEDIKAYEKLSAGMKSRTKDEKKLDNLFKKAAEAPFEVCKIAAVCLKLCKTLVEIGNKNLITDTAVAVILLEGAFFSAKFNVYINLKYVKDMDYIGRIHNELAPLEEELPRLKEEILEMCEEVIK